MWLLTLSLNAWVITLKEMVLQIQNLIFATENVTVSGTEATSYTVTIPAQDAANTYASHLLYLVTQDAEVTLTDIIVTSYHEAQ